MSQPVSPSDDARVDEVIAAFLDGGDGDREALLARYPSLAGELRAFFANHDSMRNMAQSAGEATQDWLGGQAPPPRPGTDARCFGDYELLEEIARGGMGVVYKARQTSLNRVVALKMILAGQFASEDDVKRFYREAEIAAALDHPGIVPIYEVGQNDGHHYYTMAYVEGQNLSAAVAGRPPTPRQAAELVRTIAEAVQHAHSKGLVHRDLKPANVLIDKEGKPRVADFGLARRVMAAGDVTAPGQIVGTPSYMPPEQARGDVAQVGPACDVYSLGAILYSLLTGRPPFHGERTLDIVLAVLNDDPVEPRRLNPRIARDLQIICLKCLRKEPHNRYASAHALAADLTRFLNGEEIQARPAGGPERTLRWLRRRRKLLVTAAAAALLAVAIAWAATMFAQGQKRRQVIRQADAFVAALNADDAAAIRALLTDKARANFAPSGLDALLARHARPITYEVSAVDVGDDGAQVDLVLGGPRPERWELRLRREGEVWLIHRIDAASDVMRFALNLEVPQAAWAEPPPRKAPAAALSLEEFTARWQTELDLKDEPARTALDRLTADLGLSLVLLDEQPERLKRKLSLRHKGSRLSAVEEICRALDLHPVYEGQRLRLAAGRRALPAAFAGPFLVEAASVSQSPYATGNLTLAVRAHGFPDWLIERWDRRAQIEAVTNAEGTDVRDEDALHGGDGWMNVSGVYQFRQGVGLKNLLRNVKTVSVRGHVSVKLPGPPRKLLIKSMTPGAKDGDDKVSVTLASIGVGAPCNLELTLRGVGFADAAFSCRDEHGAAIAIQGTTHFGGDGETGVQLIVARQPASIEITAPEQIQEVRYDFRLSDVPLPRPAEMPEKLLAPRFPGHKAPATVEFVAIAARGDFAKLSLRVTNHADAPIRRLALKHVYRDAGGKYLKDFTSTHAASPQEKKEAIVVGARETAVFTAAAFFMPPETERVEIEVQGVEFADATWWRP